MCEYLKLEYSRVKPFVNYPNGKIRKHLHEWGSHKFITINRRKDNAPTWHGWSRELDLEGWLYSLWSPRWRALVAPLLLSIVIQVISWCTLFRHLLYVHDVDMNGKSSHYLLVLGLPLSQRRPLDQNENEMAHIRRIAQQPWGRYFTLYSARQNDQNTPMYLFCLSALVRLIEFKLNFLQYQLRRRRSYHFTINARWKSGSKLCRMSHNNYFYFEVKHLKMTRYK